MTERLDAAVHGDVQGVGFRWFVQRHAARLGLTGWTANQDDGTVRLVVEGSPEALDEMESALRQGPSGASVSRVEERRTPATGSFQGFEIRAFGHRGD